MDTTNLCYHFGVCGGCEHQNIEYKDQLAKKQEFIKQLFEDFEVLEYSQIIPSPEIWYYRNKMEFIVGKEKTGNIVSGLRQKGKFYKIVNLQECRISFVDVKKILDTVREWVKELQIEPYDLFTHKGRIRYIVVRHSKTNNKLMLNLVVTGTKYQVEHNEHNLYQTFVERVKNIQNISSVYLSINNKLSDNAVPEDILHLYGDKYLVETVNGINYQVYPQTFFQPNTKCCEVLYKIILEEILEGNILDLYCGSGGITLQIAKSNLAEKIIGVDVSQENVMAAQKNAEFNNCTKNLEFVCDQVEVFLSKLWKSKFITNLSTLIVDPPRPGLSKKVKSVISNLTPNRIIYVSCNPQTLYEDLKSFVKFYKIKKIIPIDMFPHTPHIELVCVLDHR